MQQSARIKGRNRSKKQQQFLYTRGRRGQKEDTTTNREGGERQKIYKRMNVACGGRGGDNSKDTKINRGGDDVILQCATVFFIRSKCDK